MWDVVVDGGTGLAQRASEPTGHVRRQVGGTDRAFAAKPGADREIGDGRAANDGIVHDTVG